MIKQIGKYDERNRFWTEQALNQFGNASNFFFLISTGFLAFLLERNKLETIFKIDFSLTFKWSIFFYALAIICSVLSLFASAMTVLSRLHDLRLTRHVVWIRKKSYDDHKFEFCEEHMDLSGVGFGELFQNLISTLMKNDYFINDDDIASTSIIKKFSALRKRNLLLAKFSWKSMNFQIATLLFSLLLYVLSNIT